MSKSDAATIEIANECDPATRQWFALYVKPRHEKVVATMLRSRGYCELTPLYRRYNDSNGPHLPLFPGYVFCHFDWNKRFPIVSVPAVFFVVGNGRVPTPIPQEEIARLSRVASCPLEKAPVDHLVSGQNVTLTDGPLRGLDGVIRDSGSLTFLIVSVTLLQRSVQVKIDRRWVAPTVSKPFPRMRV
jgi:transcription termination/antitermination protein NusG